MATAIITNSAFLKIIRDNKLVDADKLEECLRNVAQSVQTGEDPLPVADALVENRLLTRFQANLLTEGKSRSLRLNSKYRLIDRLGAGGMGLVYLCEHVRMKRLVALKVLPSAQAKEPGTLERFQREAQAVASLKHRNIVQAFDIDSDNAIHYLVMEYIDGLNLEKLVAKSGPLEPARAANYIAQAAEGLQHAADSGLVHRDIKPSNLLIDRENCIKVLDMGLARFFDTRNDNLTERFDNNAIIGTADFISPEQALNSHKVDIRADIYSLGCTFYYLLTGKAPFHDANLTQKLLAHQIREPAPIEKFAPGIDARLVEIIRKMMAKKADDRYQTPGEVAAELTPWAELPLEPPAELTAGRSDTLSDTAETANTMKRVTQSNSSPATQRRSASSRSMHPNVQGCAVRGSRTPKRSAHVQLPQTRRQAQIPDRRERRGPGTCCRGAAHRSAVGVEQAGAGRGRRPHSGRPGRPQRTTPVPPATIEPTTTAKTKPDKPPVVVAPEPARKLPWNPATASDDVGFMQLRPDALDSDPRTQSSDTLALTEADLSRPALQNALKRKLAGMKASAGSLIPDAVVMPAGERPSALLMLAGPGNLRSTDGAPNLVAVAKEFTGVKPDSIVRLENDIEVPKGTTAINALIAPFIDISAPEGGSAVKLGSGAILFTAKSFTKVCTVGAGQHPLSFDFGGKAGYVYLCCEQDYSIAPFNGNFVLRAQLTHFGDNPLIISGMGCNVVRLDNPSNNNPMLVVQGLQQKARRRFHIKVTADGNLGAPGGPILLNEAGITYSGGGELVIDRPLTIQKTAQTAAGLRHAKLHWAGKVDGTGKLQILSTGQVTLSRLDNSYSGGTDVQGATLVLKGDRDGQYGTPAGLGPVAVSFTGVLSGTGQIMQELVVRGGILQPGNDEGKSLICNGRLELQRLTMAKAERVPQLSFRLSSPKARPLICASPTFALDLNDALLDLTFVGSFTPAKSDKFVLVENRSGRKIIGEFQGAPQNGTVKTADGRWLAKITYTGQAASGNLTGGNDVMVYDFALVNP